jgi:hypothetical protein
MKYIAVGITDEVTSCDCCGRTGLKRTVMLEDSETQEMVHYGTTCAAYALYRSRSQGKVDIVLSHARWRHQADPVIQAVRTAKAEGKSIPEAVQIGRDIALTTRSGGGSISVSGFDSWGCVRIHYCAGKEEVIFDEQAYRSK